MATRSRIGVELERGKVISVYCHHDGYIAGVGKDLMKKFPTGTNPKEVEKYIREGDRSSTDLSYAEWKGGKHPPRNRASVSLFFDGDIEEYGYLYTAEGEWLVKKAGSQVERDPVPLAYVVSETVNI